MIIGKTNVPELTIWPFTETATFGVTRNPWDLQRTPGGSSGGSGAAVAAGLVGAALGSDGGGSIRIPAAWCGLFGLKPQRGRVSLAPRPRAWHGLSRQRRAHAAGRRHGAVPRRRLRHHRRRRRPCPAPGDHLLARPPRRPPGRLRIAYSTKIPPGVIPKLDPDARRAVEQTVELLRSLGHELVERDPDYGNDAIPTLIVRYLRGIHDDAAGASSIRERTWNGARARWPASAACSRSRLCSGRSPTRRTFAGRLNAIFADHDVLLTPATRRRCRRAIGAARGPRAHLDVQRGRRLGPLQRRLEPHRPARRLGARGLRRRRPAPLRAARGARRRRARRCWRSRRSSRPSAPWEQERPPGFS